MAIPRLYIADGPALVYARAYLAEAGVSIADRISENVSHILLPIPTKVFPDTLPQGCTVIGGNLPCSGVDLLKDPIYLAQNAAITAHGAVKVAMNATECCLWECNALILGWGRIAQCLAHLLKGMGVQVTIAARKAEALAMAGALGFEALPLEGISCKGFRLVFNTIPAELGLQQRGFDPGCVKIELASVKALPGEDVIWARGLPGKEAAESSGRLIAERVHLLMKQEELSHYSGDCHTSLRTGSQ